MAPGHQPGWQPLGDAMSSTALSTPIIRTRVHLAHTIKEDGASTN